MASTEASPDIAPTALAAEEAVRPRAARNELAVPPDFTQAALSLPDQLKTDLARMSGPEEVADVLDKVQTMSQYARRIRAATEEVKQDDHGLHRIETKKRDRGPYVDFVWIRTEDAGDTVEPYEDDNNVGQGGMSPTIAAKVAKELERAVEYIKQLEG